jgi:ATP dependent DNA ligase domain
MLWRPSPAGFVQPCIPTLASRPPTGPQWVHEIKHDGYRLIARKQAGRVRLLTRRGYDWSDRYPRIVEAVSALRAGSTTIDGEAVVCDASGLAVFDMLHSRRHDDRAILYAFDLLELDGEDFRHCMRARPGSLSCSRRRRPASSTTSTSRATARWSLRTPAGSVSKASSRSIASARIGRAKQDLAQDQESGGTGRDTVCAGGRR